ncbi:(2Fe-2S)-binding protein [Actinacidiphila rubida]|uniref:FhuF 2Fe-2S C-terminal domain-containing protein n=1 Tax=Actinacidiphila rubida TaxID=310780 RepID=A0A1H8TCI1_9ACTN|nr:(2Fe-2S)-binding protein [Actinacidiphila rubida]SEO88612.1 FhuF 2Fe-2S C-terminal domain-containing protein [Actinacidiphila rubida]
MTEGAAGRGRSGEAAAPGGAAELPGTESALAALGPFFTVDRHSPAHPPSGTWRELREIIRDPAVLDERVSSVRQFLAAGSGGTAGTVEIRVAASVAHLGMAARLASPLLATAFLRRRVPLLTLDDLRWQPLLGGAFPLSLPWDPRTADLARAGGPLSTVLVDGVARPLAGAFARFGVSERILRGNTASALAGAARMLATARGEARLLVGPSPEARLLVEELLRHPYLRDAGAYAPTGPGSFRRRSCCLIYRAAPGRDGALCGDCVLDRPPARTP